MNHLYGTLGLILRLLLLASASSLATLGFVEMSADGATLTINVEAFAESAAEWIGALISGGAWFVWWRSAKRNGGKT